MILEPGASHLAGGQGNSWPSVCIDCQKPSSPTSFPGPFWVWWCGGPRERGCRQAAREQAALITRPLIRVPRDASTGSVHEPWKSAWAAPLVRKVQGGDWGVAARRHALGWHNGVQQLAACDTPDAGDGVLAGWRGEGRKENGHWFTKLVGCLAGVPVRFRQDSVESRTGARRKLRRGKLFPRPSPTPGRLSPDTNGNACNAGRWRWWWGEDVD